MDGSHTCLTNLKLLTYYATQLAKTTPVVTIPDEGVGSDNARIGDDTEGRKR